MKFQTPFELYLNGLKPTSIKPTQTIIYHGCGHYIIRAFLNFDNCIMIIEDWYYDKNLNLKFSNYSQQKHADSSQILQPYRFY